MTTEDMMKALSDASGKDVAVVWVRRFNNFKVFLHDEITPDTSLGDNGLVFGGDDIEEGLDAADTMAKLGLMR